jgi:predicted ATPase
VSVSEVSIAGYRSIRDVRLPLGPLTVVTGPNGSGKTNLYRAISLIAQAARGALARTLATEGGMPSVLWAGPRRNNKPVRLRLGVATNEFSYEIACGLPIPSRSVFVLDPEVKEEFVWHGGSRRPSNTLLERGNSTARVRDSDGAFIEYPLALSASESVLSQLQEPHLYPELWSLRNAMRDWRFYHHFRTDPQSPLRTPQIATRTSVLSNEGEDLAAALQTIREIGDSRRLDAAVHRAFPNAELNIVMEDKMPRLHLGMRLPGVQRELEAREFSDGTLRYLCLAAALLSPRPPELLALNEPETSLHPDLIEPLAELIVEAAEFSQIWVTTHSESLAGHIERLSGAHSHRLEMVDGETRVTAPQD